MNIAILIATYNGSRFINEQIDSILKDEDYSTISKIIVTDDGSLDDTVELIRKYNDIIVVNNLSQDKGPASNFVSGLDYCKDMDYVFFCDQDDIWFKNKISTFLKHIKYLDDNFPGVIYSDLKLVDTFGCDLGKTFFENESIPCDWGVNVNNLFLQNCAPGCAMMINRKAIGRVLDTYSKNVVMHDWWVILFASLYKNVIAIEDCTISYRQHENNAVGASRKVTLRNIPILYSKSKSNLSKVIFQISYFYSSLSQAELALLSTKQKMLLDILSRLSVDSSFLLRCKLFFYPGKFKSSFIRDFFTRVYFLFF